MGLWDSANRLRDYEGKESGEAHLTAMQKRVILEGTYSVRKCVWMMIQGFYCALAFTGFEYALKNPQVEGTLETLFRVGFFISLAGVLLIPYGLYQMIKSVRQ